MSGAENTRVAFRFDESDEKVVKIKNFVILLGSMNRLIGVVSRLAPLKTAGLGLAEWLILSSLSEDIATEAHALAKLLGISEQRANQVIQTFAEAGLVIVDQTEDLSGVRLTDEGKIKVDAVNSDVEMLIATALKGREKLLVSTYRQLMILLKLPHAK